MKKQQKNIIVVIITRKEDFAISWNAYEYQCSVMFFEESRLEAEGFRSGPFTKAPEIIKALLQEYHITAIGILGEKICSTSYFEIKGSIRYEIRGHNIYMETQTSSDVRKKLSEIEHLRNTMLPKFMAKVFNARYEASGENFIHFLLNEGLVEFLNYSPISKDKTYFDRNPNSRYALAMAFYLKNAPGNLQKQNLPG
ncbi:MAG: hypothetical protein J5I50_10935 [Chitinophagaceae bacterium]|nr:hypothetical protein [Chitinophagaceae bacterium]